MPLVEKSVVTDQADIRLLESSGSGFPLVLLHGSGSSKDVFARQLKSELAEKYHIVAIDLPGHGSSSDALEPAVAYSIGGLADTVEHILHRLGIGRAAIFGWSLGGHVAIELAGRNAVVAGLMLTGAPPVGQGPVAMLRGFHTSWDMLLASKEHFTPRDAERFERLCFDGNGAPGFLDAIRRADGRVRSVFFRSMMRGDGADQKRVIEQADFPVAMINGAQEPFARLGYIAGLHYRMLWRDHCFVLQGAGHAAFWDRPQEFNALLDEFMQDVALNEVTRTQRRIRSA